MRQRDPYEFYKAALAAKPHGWPRNGAEPRIIIDHPQAGFYRMRVKNVNGDERYVPVAYWIDGFDVKCRVEDQDVGDQSAANFWQWCAGNPITEDEYRRVAEQGLPWSDAAPTAPTAQGEVATTHNEPPPDETPDEKALRELRVEIEGRDAAVSLCTVNSDQTAAQAQALRSELLALRKRADDARDAEKRPHLEAGRAVDRKWKPIVDMADAAARKLAVSIGAWSDHQRREAQKAAEAAAAKARAAGKNEPAAAPPPPPTKVKGATGRAASITTVRQVKQVLDQDAAYAFLKNQPEVRDAIIDAANRMLAQGHDVPGVEVEEKSRVR